MSAPQEEDSLNVAKWSSFNSPVTLSRACSESSIDSRADLESNLFSEAPGSLTASVVADLNHSDDAGEEGALSPGFLPKTPSRKMLGADSILAEVGPAGSDVTEVSATAKSFDKSPTPPPTVLRRPAPVVPQDLDDAMIISRRQGESEMISDVIGGSRPVLNSSELSCLLNDTFWREDNFNAESCAESLISALDSRRDDSLLQFSTTD